MHPGNNTYRGPPATTVYLRLEPTQSPLPLPWHETSQCDFRTQLTLNHHRNDERNVRIMTQSRLAELNFYTYQRLSTVSQTPH